MSILSDASIRKAVESRLVEPTTVLDVAKRQGVSPTLNLMELAGGWPDDENLDEFLETLRLWRGKS